MMMTLVVVVVVMMMMTIMMIILLTLVVVILLDRHFQEETRQLARVMTGNQSSVTVRNVLPDLIRISSTKEVTPLLSGGDRRDCVFSFRALSNDTSLGWWEMRCGTHGACPSVSEVECSGPKGLTVNDAPLGARSSRSRTDRCYYSSDASINFDT
jgi:hypothetical protein